MTAGALAAILQGDVGTWPRGNFRGYCATRHSIHPWTGLATVSFVLGGDTVSVLYVQAHGAPRIDEQGLAQQMLDESESRNNAQGAGGESGNHAGRAYEATRQNGLPAGTPESAANPWRGCPTQLTLWRGGARSGGREPLREDAPKSRTLRQA